MNILDFNNSKLFKYINYDLGLMSRIKKSFKYVVGKLGIQSMDKLSNLVWLEGKNYNWVVMGDGLVTLLIRKYGSHFTFYCRFNDKTIECGRNSEFSIFTYGENSDLM